MKASGHPTVATAGTGDVAPLDHEILAEHIACSMALMKAAPCSLSFEMGAKTR